MKFRLTSTIWDENEILGNYPWLSEFPIEFSEPHMNRFYQSHQDIYINIDTLEELIDFKQRAKNEIIIGYGLNRLFEDEITIEIYDGYRE